MSVPIRKLPDAELEVMQAIWAFVKIEKIGRSSL